MKFKIYRNGETWYLIVPFACTFPHEHGRYHRRTFPEIIKLMDFYIARARARGPVIIYRRLAGE